MGTIYKLLECEELLKEANKEILRLKKKLDTALATVQANNNNLNNIPYDRFIKLLNYKTRE